MRLFSRFKSFFSYPIASATSFLGFSNSFLSVNIRNSTKRGYEENLDVYAIIRTIVDAYNNGRWVVEERDRTGKWTEINDTSIHELMANPNNGKGYTWRDIDEQLLIYLLCSGNCFLHGGTQIGKSLIEEVDVLPIRHVDIRTNNDFFNPSVKYLFYVGGGHYEFLPENIEHTRLFNPSYGTVEESFWGLSPVQVAAKALTVSTDRWTADAAILQNKGAIGMVTDRSAMPMRPEEAAPVQEHFDGIVSGAKNFGKIKVTNKDLRFVPLAMTPSDLKLLERGVVTLRSLCNIWQIDSSIFNDPDNKKFSNLQEADKALYTKCVIPKSALLDEKHTRFIARNHFKKGNVRMRKDFSHIPALQKNKKEEAETDKIIASGVKTIMETPTSPAGKSVMLRRLYDLSDEEIKAITDVISDGF